MGVCAKLLKLGVGGVVHASEHTDAPVPVPVPVPVSVDIKSCMLQ